MSEPHFPPPRAKLSTSEPYRTPGAASAAASPPGPRAPIVVRRAEPPEAAPVRPAHKTAGPPEPEPPPSPGLRDAAASAAVSLAVKVAGLAITLGLIYGLVWAFGRGGPLEGTVPSGVGIALILLFGFVAGPIVLVLRVRALFKRLFAQGSD